MVAFKKLDDGEKVLPGYTEISCHLIFEVKFDLRRNARHVAGDHGSDGLLSSNDIFKCY